MANKIFVLISLLLPVAAMLPPVSAVDYFVYDNMGNSESGSRFRNQIGFDYARQSLSSATDFIWGIFRQTDNPSDRRTTAKISLIMENSKDVAYSSNDEIHYNVDSLDFSGDAKGAFTGVIYHEVTHSWQWNGKGQAPVGLIEGIADYVRLKAGYAPGHWIKEGEGDRWDQGYAVTARFLDYCNSLRDGFVADMNKKMRDGYNASFFVDLLGKNVEELWRDYKAKYGK